MGSVAVQRILASLLLGGVALVAGLLAFVGMHAVDFSPVVARLYLQLDFAVTPLARPFLALLCIASLAVAIWDLKRGTPRAGIMLALFVAAMVGVLLARSAAAFLLCWELMSLLSIFLVAAESARRTVRRAAFAYALMSQLSALAIAVALATLALNAGSGSFARIALHAVALPATTRGIVIGTAFIGFGAKAGLVPLQFWLPRAHPAAPANASALLSGVMLEIALFGLTLLVFSFAAPLPLIAGVVLLVVGLAGVLLGGLYAAIESELKRLLAYSSIEHLGVMTAALGLAAIGGAIENPMLVAVALVAMLFHAINHAAFKSLLFLGAGTLIERLDHVTDLDRLRGLARTTLRRSAPWLLVGCLAACALPPSNGFISEWFVLHGFILALGLGVPWLVFVAAFALLVLLLGGGLAAAGFVKFVGVALLGEPRREHIAEIPERNDFAVLALGLLAAICLLFGFLPALVALPLLHIVAEFTGTTFASAPNPLGGITWLPFVVALPILGALASWWFARRPQRESSVWSCGSALPARSLYGATALTKTVRRVFAFGVFPECRRHFESQSSPDFPERIEYRVSTRDPLSEGARWLAAFVQRLARKLRIVQSGRMRIYIAYAAVTVALVLILAR